ncbi:MAG: ATP-binding protein [Acidimicrobiia bacterium]
MSIRTAFRGLSSLLGVLLIGLFVILGLLVMTQGDIREAEERRSTSVRLAMDLRHSSDDLTRMARLYVSTGESRYRDYFNEIAAIRDGSAPRPDRYDLVYWDLVGPDDVRPRGAGEPRALEELMAEAGITAQEFGKLRDAENRSNALTLIENVAMDAVVGRFDDGTGQSYVEGAPDLEMARELMFGDDYMAHKAAIMEPINEFLEMLDQRTTSEVAVLNDRAQVLGWMALLVSASAISISGLTVAIVRRRVLAPLTILQASATEISAGDYSQPVEYTSDDEFGDLVGAFTDMQERLDETMSELVEKGQVLEAEVQARTSELRDTVNLLEENSGRLERSNRELHEFAAEREKVRLELEAAVRSKDELIASVSHELRTPLTAVLGFAHMLQDPASALSDEDRTDLQRLIVEEGTDLANIVDDLLVAARAETGILSVVCVPVNLRAQVAQVLENSDQQSSERIRAVNGNGHALGDPSRVRQIIRNLVTNAVRYGGDSIWINLSVDDAAARLAVIDNGVGVPAEEQDRLFEAYWQAYRDPGKPSSLGLGLSVSEDLARLMDGDLVYRREAGQTVFELTLPRIA